MLGTSRRPNLGTRYTCFGCGTKFYDLNRPAAICPECGLDQVEAPARDIKSLLKSSGRPSRPSEPDTSDSSSLDEDDESSEFSDDGDSTYGDGDDDDYEA